MSDFPVIILYLVPTLFILLTWGIQEYLFYNENNKQGYDAI